MQRYEPMARQNWSRAEPRWPLLRGRVRGRSGRRSAAACLRRPAARSSCGARSPLAFVRSVQAAPDEHSAGSLAAGATQPGGKARASQFGHPSSREVHTRLAPCVRPFRWQARGAVYAPTFIVQSPPTFDVAPPMERLASRADGQSGRRRALQTQLTQSRCPCGLAGFPKARTVPQPDTASADAPPLVELTKRQPVPAKAADSRRCWWRQRPVDQLPAVPDGFVLVHNPMLFDQKPTRILPATPERPIRYLRDSFLLRPCVCGRRGSDPSCWAEGTANAEDGARGATPFWRIAPTSASVNGHSRFPHLRSSKNRDVYTILPRVTSPLVPLGMRLRSTRSSTVVPRLTRNSRSILLGAPRA